METRPNLVIKRGSGWQLINLRELADYRDLFYFLVSRDLSARYRQTVLGGLWAIIQPLFLMIVFTLFFGRLANLPSDGIPYPIFNYSAMVAWTYFSNAVAASSMSLLRESALISKVYFPRVFAPLVPVIAYLLDFAVAFAILLVMMLYFHVYPNRLVVFLPLMVLLMMLTASGVGMLLSALNAKYRDVGMAIPFLVQVWMFASPVVYPVSMIPERFRLIYAINPMAGIIEGFRSALLGTVAFPTQMLLVSTLVSVIIFLVGALYFRRVERSFADVI